MTVAFRLLQPFGVEIDLDLGNPLSAAQQDDLRRLYSRHDLIVAHGGQMDMEQQARAMSYLGPVLRTEDSMGEISRESPIGLGGAALCFHSDYVYSPEPLLGISLHALDVVAGETSTRFASGRTALDALRSEDLPEDLPEDLGGLSSLQVFGVALDRRNRLAEVATLPSTVHPLVWDHPGTGGRFLLAPEMTTDSIVGLSPADSEALVARLFAALYSPANVLEHRWQPGDTVIWNNVSVMHARGDYSATEHRVLQRVAIGTKGYFELYPEMAEELSTERWSDDDASVPPG
jgi:taurine dioxygenase